MRDNGLTAGGKVEAKRETYFLLPRHLFAELRGTDARCAQPLQPSRRTKHHPFLNGRQLAAACYGLTSGKDSPITGLSSVWLVNLDEVSSGLRAFIGFCSPCPQLTWGRVKAVAWRPDHLQMSATLTPSALSMFTSNPKSQSRRSQSFRPEQSRKPRQRLFSVSF